MAAPRRDRNPENRAKQRKPKRPSVPKAPEPTIKTKYGELRVRRVRGREPSWWAYELLPEEMSKLPPGALRASPLRQIFGLGGPKLFYVDMESKCRTCRADFIFSAREQRHWYENLKFFESSTAVDCPNCRRNRRAERRLMARHAEVIGQAHDQPKDAQAHLELAKSTVAIRLRFGRGNLAGAISAARKARRLDPRQVEALYWEGRLQEIAQRHDRARQCLEDFTSQARNLRSKSMAKMKREASRLLGN